MESGISFFIGQLGMILFLWYRYPTLSMEEFIMWASLEFAVGGYITYQIQKQKKQQWGNDGGWGSTDHGNWRRDCDEYYRDEYSEEISYGNKDGSNSEEDPEPEPPNSTNYPV